MNIFLWVLQAILALHTAIGAFWKFSNSAQSLPSLKAIPSSVWMVMIGIELLCAIGLVLPAISKPLAILVPIAAICIAAEMLVFSGLHVASGEGENSQLIYWFGVAAICGFIAYGRLVLSPL